MRVLRLRLVAVTVLCLWSFGVSGQPAARTGASQAPGDSLSPAQKPDDPIRLTRDLITLNVSVLDPAGRFVTGLDLTNFEVYDEKIKQ
jgi:hypothetical protein